MRKTYQKIKTQTAENLNGWKYRYKRTPKKADFILGKHFHDLRELASLFSLNEYGCRVISGKRIC